LHQPTRDELIDKVFPRSVLEPLVRNEILQMLWIALAFGIAFRQFKNHQIAQGKTDYLPLETAIEVGLRLMMQVLLWVIAVIPVAVFSVVVAVVGRQGLDALKSLGVFVLVVLAALAAQFAFYLLRILLEGRTSPLRVLAGVRDALVTAFATASSTATMPINPPRSHSTRSPSPVAGSSPRARRRWRNGPRRRCSTRL